MMNEDKKNQRTTPDPLGEGDIFATSEPRMVTVRMFEREYHIKSDQPQLVELLAAEINREAKKLQEVCPVKMGPGHFDWPVQVAFRLALSRFRAQEAYNSLKHHVDEQTEKAARRGSAGLEDLEAERLAKRITADLDEVILSGPFAARPGVELDAEETEKLAQRITAGLDDLETEKLAQRVSAGLEQVEIEAEEIAQRILKDLDGQ